jgi:hypothetical protein
MSKTKTKKTDTTGPVRKKRRRRRRKTTIIAKAPVTKPTLSAHLVTPELLYNRKPMPRGGISISLTLR